VSKVLPASVQQHPDLDRWIVVEPSGRITISTGKVEIGQGIKTALTLIVAEELDVAPSRIDVRSGEAGNTPDEGVTSGSLSVEVSGSALRVAAATARRRLLEGAVRRLGVGFDTLHVEDGTVTSTQSNLDTDYWTLQAGQPFSHKITAFPALKDPNRYVLVGHSVSRVDLPAKLLGQAVFVHDLRPPNLLHARVVRPPSPGAALVELRLDNFESEYDARVIRDGGFLAVTSVHEEDAVRAAARLSERCRWQVSDLASSDTIHSELRRRTSATLRIVDGTPVDDHGEPRALPPGAHTSLSASYSRPYQMHASLGPSAALAHFSDAILTVWTHSQAVEALRGSLADVLALRFEQIRVVHQEGAGCYGHNGADDAALDAALVALASPECPVLLQWSRADEHRYEPYAPAMVVDMGASLDESGWILDWRHDLTSFSHAGRPVPVPNYSGLLAAWSLKSPVPARARQPSLSKESGSHRNAEPIYSFSQKFITKNFAGAGPVRSSSVRSLGGFANVFAIESFMDELAAVADADVFEFRSRHLEDQRATAVLETLRDELPDVASDHGRGIAIARYKNCQSYAAVAVDLVVRDTGEIVLKSALIVADAGCVIDPDGARNQLEGAFIQAASWTLLEAVKFDESGITSTDWESYPILRFDQIPDVRSILLQHQDGKAMGIGEAMTGPTPAAIANAVYDAIGVRLRHIPFTPTAVLEAARGS